MFAAPFLVWKDVEAGEAGEKAVYSVRSHAPKSPHQAGVVIAVAENLGNFPGWEAVERRLNPRFLRLKALALATLRMALPCLPSRV